MYTLNSTMECDEDEVAYKTAQKIVQTDSLSTLGKGGLYYLFSPSELIMARLIIKLARENDELIRKLAELLQKLKEMEADND